MSAFVIKLFNMSITASIVVLAVLIFRLIFRRAPKWIYCLLWSFVGLRLVLPFSVQSSFSLVPSVNTVSIAGNSRPELHTGLGIINGAVNDFIGSHYYEGVTVPEGTTVNIMSVLSWVWLIGVFAMALYAAVSYMKIKLRVSASILCESGVYICDDIDTPFILGIISPRIYMPSGLSGEHIPHVIAHETAHISRRDYIWKPLGFLLLSLYWFNPLMWVAYIILCRDIEGACDERVVREMELDEKKNYSAALAFCGVQRKMISACPLAFGEVGVKNRIRSVLSYKKPAFWVIVTALVLSVLIAFFFLTDPLYKVDDRLAVAIDMQIAEHHRSPYTEDHYVAMDWKVVGKEGIGNTYTLYMWVYYQEYLMSSTPDDLLKDCGAHTFTALRVKRDGDEYKILEYWIPEDGSYHRDSITDKVPFWLWGKAFNGQGYVSAQIERCDEMAREYFAEAHANIDLFAYKDGPDPIGASLVLLPDGNASFSFSGFSSHLCFGAYEIKDGYLKFVCRDADHIWMFRVEEEGFAFDASRSSAMPMFKFSANSNPEVAVPDGALFVPDEGVGKYKPYSYIDPSWMASDTVVGITDLVKKYGLAAGDAEEVFFEDEDYFYIFPTYKRSEKIIVTYDDGSTEMLSEAIPNGRVTIGDLDRFGIEYMLVSKSIRDIVYHSERGGTAQMLELFYEDDTYEYYFPTIRSDAVIVYFANGEEVPIKEAMSSGRVTPKDLTLFDIKYYKEVK